MSKVSPAISTPAEVWAMSNMVKTQVSVASLYALLRPVRSITRKNFQGSSMEPPAIMLRVWVSVETPSFTPVTPLPPLLAAE